MANPDASSEQIAAWIGSPAEHAQAADAIGRLGDAAIPGLNAYLDLGPQVMPQPRCFAVAMLARLHSDTATGSLRAVLHRNPLGSLSPAFAESEYVVKSDALEVLCTRAYSALDEDIAFCVCERLRVAVVAVGRFGLVKLATALVDVLDDDVLAEAAIGSLEALGHAVDATITLRLDAWLIEAQDNARRRLALIRALRVLHRVGNGRTEGAAAIRRALENPHAAVRAAAALQVWPDRRDEAIIERLLRGAIGFDPNLADDCRAILTDAHPAAMASAARALQRDAEPDLYGELHRLSSGQREWLDALRRNAGKH